ncbi:MAG: Appr-1-p processing protein [Candidatus Sumerlaea sp.]|nr:MAG: Appr-1-p processing protein [Candidatus Sumerlaea sp.]
MRVVIRQGNIVETSAEVIVNAANTDLILGGGVAGAIRRAGGESIQQECSAHGPIHVGEVAVTGAGRLPQRYIFHAATMTLRDAQTSAEIVAACTRNALQKAEELGCRSIAFPALGTGVAGLALRTCAEAMLREIYEFRLKAKNLELVELVLFDPQAARVFAEEWARLSHASSAQES